MKKHTLVFNILLISGLTLFLGSCKNSNVETPAKNTTPVTQDSAAANNYGIVYVNIDTVLNKFDMYQDLQGELSAKLQDSQNKLAEKEAAYKKGVKNYQYKAQHGLITRSEAQQIEKNLSDQQQNLMQLQNKLQNDLQEQSSVAQHQVLNYIMQYLKEVKKDHGYNYVLGATFGGNILYANQKFNITNEVIEGLNKKYSAEQKAKNK